MRFYFPDSQDQIDPAYDFGREEYGSQRVRQQDDLYAHEALSPTPYDGVLVSKAIVDGTRTAAGKYSMSQRQRLYRVGVRKFFRLDRSGVPPLSAMGDCGAFTYIREERPAYTPDEVVEFYETCGFDRGLSVDHVIPTFRAVPDADASAIWSGRRELTLQLADEFLRASRTSSFVPVGVAQGWDPTSMAASVSALQDMGYRWIALGGLALSKTADILAGVRAASERRLPDTQFHLLGVTRPDSIVEFESLGVTSFDSTSPFRQAFKDDRDNYHMMSDTFTALRVPQVAGNPLLKRLILAGEVDHRGAVEKEKICLAVLRAFGRGDCDVDAALEALADYEVLHEPRTRRVQQYEKTLRAAPWRSCSCAICREVGIEVVIFRGTERNKRRGFHNLAVFRARLEYELGAGRKMEVAS
ncbi:MAG: hypothetical protein QOK05_513 [Chloroflexota bacterium]|nr:hypothetical protein [Chloroflexota bacterium]